MSDAFIGSRVDYTYAGLLEADLDASPIRQLQKWIDEARAEGVIEPNAMCVSSVGSDGFPSSRVVLLRGLTDAGLAFFTNYESRKGEEIEANGKVCVNFWWGALERQVRVEGIATRLSPAESDAYFAARPYDSQTASAASPQSRVIGSREELEQLVSEFRTAHPEVVARPENWGGYLIAPHRFEFWQGRKARLHDRLVYTPEGGSWVVARLAP